MNSSKVKIYGRLALTLRHTDGRVEVWEGENLIVDTGYQALAAQLGTGGTTKVINTIALGTNGSPAVPTDVAITNEFTKGVTATTFPGNTVQFTFVIEESEANGVTYREFGLKTQDSTLFSRLVRAPIAKDNTLRIEGTWTVGP